MSDPTEFTCPRCWYLITDQSWRECPYCGREKGTHE